MSLIPVPNIDGTTARVNECLKIKKLKIKLTKIREYILSSTVKTDIPICKVRLQGKTLRLPGDLHHEWQWGRAGLQPQLSACSPLFPSQPSLQLHVTLGRVPCGHPSSRPKLIFPTHTPRPPVGVHRCHCHPLEECTLESDLRSLGRES